MDKITYRDIQQSSLTLRLQSPMRDWLRFEEVKLRGLICGSTAIQTCIEGLQVQAGKNFSCGQGFLHKTSTILSKIVQQTAGKNGLQSTSNLPHVCDTSPWTT
jgi:hypothetical protein